LPEHEAKVVNAEQGMRNDLKPSHHVLRLPFWIPGSELPAHQLLSSGSASW